MKRFYVGKIGVFKSLEHVKALIQTAGVKEEIRNQCLANIEKMIIGDCFPIADLIIIRVLDAKD
jgi:hypothetical protein